MLFDAIFGLVQYDSQEQLQSDCPGEEDDAHWQYLVRTEADAALQKKSFGAPMSHLSEFYSHNI